VRRSATAFQNCQSRHLPIENDSANSDRRQRPEHLTPYVLPAHTNAKIAHAFRIWVKLMLVHSSDIRSSPRSNHTSCLTNRSGTRARAPTARALAAGTFLPGGTYSRVAIWRSMDFHEGRGMESALWGLWTIANGCFVQPRLHPPCWSYPQVRPQHLPSVLQGEERRHRFRQGTTSTGSTHSELHSPATSRHATVYHNAALWTTS
jgi:hypothetical protein